MDKWIKPSQPLKGELSVAPDKSISHRAIMFAALAKGFSQVDNFLVANDTMSTCNCLGQLGVDIDIKGSQVTIESPGINQLGEPEQVLDCGNSGTTLRLLTGLLAGRPFFSVVSGDESLNRRPMKRVIDPLQQMGAWMAGRHGNSYPPLAIQGGQLKGIQYQMPVASAQVKSAILLAGLQAEGKTVIQESAPSRNHSERMLAAMGARIESNHDIITLYPDGNLFGRDFVVPGDISSAAFFVVAAAIIPGSEILIRQVGVNPTRAGIIQVLRKMGACVRLENEQVVGGEPVADVWVCASPLKGVEISGDLIPSLIDEIPVLAVAMAVAEGESLVKDAGELRVKETDRIKTICSELTRMGVDIQEQEDGFLIKGHPEGLKAARVYSHGDHRIAMSLAVAGLVATGETCITRAEVVAISFPDFWDQLHHLLNS
ncbi:3-phosphoshikimate 1-carboxyvinyltransferase [Syntrophomonas erecta]